MTLKEVLHAHLPTLTATSSVRDAVDKMDIYQFTGLVILDDSHKPIGVITEGDICRAVTSNGNITGIRNENALIYASKSPTCCREETEIGEALHQMLNSGLTILPVVDADQRFLGVCMRMDLMQAMLLDIGEHAI